MELAALVQDKEFREGGVSKYEINTTFAKLFGVQDVWFAGLRGKDKSPLMTKGEIAKVLFDNKLVASLEEGLTETESLLNKENMDMSYDSFVHFQRYANPEGETKYKLQLGHYEYDCD